MRYKLTRRIFVARLSLVFMFLLAGKKAFSQYFPAGFRRKRASGPPPPPPDPANTLWLWGSNVTGEFGVMDSNNRSSPVQLASGISWKALARGGTHTLGIRSNGTLWAWGSAGSGKLGNGSASPHLSSPVQIGSLTSWVEIEASDTHSVGLRGDGTLWAWGSNTDGELGQGDTVNRSSPIQVGTLTTWKTISVSAATEMGTYGIRSDGTLWSWGGNTNGKLGIGNVAGKSSPVQVGSLSDWANVQAGSNHVIARKNSGSLWSWGYNTNGNLGIGDTSDRSSPCQIGNLTTWDNNFICSGNATYARRTDGTLWSWGINTAGQCGLGNVNNRSSPAQIGTATWWAAPGAFKGGGYGIRTDGTLWSWGQNSNGELGTGNTTGRSSPVQIGLSNLWSANSYKKGGGRFAFHGHAFKE